MYQACTTGNLTSVDRSVCDVSLGQARFFAIQRRLGAASARNSIAYADADTLATWTALFAANDETKMLRLPNIVSPVLPESTQREGPGGNDSESGVPRVLGGNPQTFTAKFEAKEQKLIEQAKAIVGDNAFYVIDAFGGIGGLVDDHDSPTQFYPVPFFNWFVGDLTWGGYDAPDYNPMSFGLLPRWSDKFHVFRPTNFDPRFDF